MCLVREHQLVISIPNSPCGTSVHNQRIERLWRDLNRTLIRFFRLIFIHLEEEYGFDIDDTVHLYCLHYVYMARINRGSQKPGTIIPFGQSTIERRCNCGKLE